MKNLLLALAQDSEVSAHHVGILAILCLSVGAAFLGALLALVAL